MPKARKNNPLSPGNSDIALLAWLAACTSVFTFLLYLKNGEVLLYGDAIAHINIARRVFDSRTPGLLQLGTVWLPLPHLLMIPFLISTKMWQTGAGGSIPSMIAYVFGVVGVFRLTRGAVAAFNRPDGVARASAWIAALIYAANPNLMYIQSTAMGEPIYLAFFIWAVVFFSEATRGDSKALVRCGLCLAGACLARYDGWFLAAAMVALIVICVLARRRSRAETSVPTTSGLVRFALISATAPALWLAYNGAVYRNPLEFENGPYSAKAIERRTQSAGNPGHPGTANPVRGGMYFLKACENNVASNPWLQRGWILLTFGSVIVCILMFRSETWRPLAKSVSPLALLLIPIPFYALSIAYSGVPIFVPQWWPFSHYNVRYGLQLLPAFSVAVALLIGFILHNSRWDWRLRFAGILALLAFVLASYSRVWREGPVCLEEALVNMKTRNQLEIQLSKWIEQLPPGATLLMYTGDHVGALQRAAIPLKQTINEGNHRVWRQPVDPQGLWERALANPPQYADYALAFEGDPIWQAVHDLHLPSLVEVHVTGQARAVLYRVR